MEASWWVITEFANRNLSLEYLHLQYWEKPSRWMLDIDLYTSRQAEVFRLASEVIRENATSLELENLLMFFLNGKQKEFSEDCLM